MTDDLRFVPDVVTIRVGDRVTWRNNSIQSHTVTADPDLAENPANVLLPPGAETFDSGFINPGEEYSMTFTVPGEYHYVCLPHEGEGMLGTIIVTE